MDTDASTGGQYCYRQNIYTLSHTRISINQNTAREQQQHHSMHTNGIQNIEKERKNERQGERKNKPNWKLKTFQIFAKSCRINRATSKNGEQERVRGRQ